MCNQWEFYDVSLLTRMYKGRCGACEKLSYTVCVKMETQVASLRYEPSNTLPAS